MSIIIDTEEIFDSITNKKKVIIPYEDYEKLISLLKNHSINVSDNIIGFHQSKKGEFLEVSKASMNYPMILMLYFKQYSVDRIW